jgi:hypothetical protein
MNVPVQGGEGSARPLTRQLACQSLWLGRSLDPPGARHATTKRFKSLWLGRSLDPPEHGMPSQSVSSHCGSDGASTLPSMQSTGEGCCPNVTACSRVARLDERSSSGRGRLRPPPDPATCVSITAARTEPRPSLIQHPQS